MNELMAATAQAESDASQPAGTPAPEDNDRSAKRKRKQFYGQTAKRGALWSLLRQGGNELISIPTSMVMARLLSPQDFGIAAAAAFFIMLAKGLTQFGFSAAIVRTKQLRPEHASSVFLINLLLGAATYGVLVAATPLIGRFFRSPEVGSVLPIAALVFVISPFGTVSAAMMQRNMQFRYTAVCDWTDTLVGAAATIVLALAGLGYWSIVYGHVIAVSVRVVLQEYLSGWRPRLTFSRAALRELVPYGLGIQSKRVLEYASFNLDNVVVGRFLGMGPLGLYDKAFSTMNRLVTRLTLGQAPFRIFAIIHEDVERFRRAYSRLILSITLIGFPVLAGCIVVAQPLFAVLYGAKWQAAVLPYQLLCVGGMLKLLNAYSSQANEASGNLWPQVRRQALGPILVVIGAAAGSLYAGVTGAAAGVVVAITILTVLMQGLVRRATGLSWGAMLAPQVPGITCASLLVLILLGTDAVFRAVAPDPAAWQLLLLQTTVGALFYGAFVFFSPFGAVREVVAETVEDILPPAWSRALNRGTKAPGA